MRIPDTSDARPSGAGGRLDIPGRVEIGSWHGKSAPERRWNVDGLIPEGNVTLLSGDGGVGKTLLALQLLGSTALSKPWLARATRPCRAIGLFCEDDEDELWRRLECVARHYGAAASDLAEHIRLFARPGDDNLLMQWPDQYGPGQATPLFNQLCDLAVDFGAELVVLDSLHDLFGGNENSRTHARQFISQLRGLAIRIRGAVLITSHPSLVGRNTGTGEAGTTAWHNAVRSRLYLTAPRSDDSNEALGDYRELITKKANYAAPGSTIKLRWESGVLVPGESRGGGGMVAAIERRTSESVFLDCLAALEKGGVRVNATKNQSNYAPRQMAGMVAAKGFTFGELALAMKRLIEAGTVAVVTQGPPSRQRSYLARVDRKEDPK